MFVNLPVNEDAPPANMAANLSKIPCPGIAPAFDGTPCTWINVIRFKCTSVSCMS